MKNKETTLLKKGMSTVELAMVLPIVLTMILMLVGLLYYFARGAYLQAVVDDSLKHGVAIVAHPGSDFATGVLSAQALDDEFLYAKTVELFTEPYKNSGSECHVKLDAYMNEKLGFYKNTLNPGSNLRIEVTTKQIALFKKVRIEVYESSDATFSKFYTYFSQSSPPPIASGEIMINDAPEMIRTVDYAAEYAAKLKVVKNLSAELKKAREVIMNFIDNPLGD